MAVKFTYKTAKLLNMALVLPNIKISQKNNIFFLKSIYVLTADSSSQKQIEFQLTSSDVKKVVCLIIIYRHSYKIQS